MKYKHWILIVKGKIIKKFTKMLDKTQIKSKGNLDKRKWIVKHFLTGAVSICILLGLSFEMLDFNLDFIFLVY